MADSDLEAIRQARLQQLQTQGSGNAGGGGGGSGGGQQDEQRSREEAQRTSILGQILEPLAADRLGRIRMVNASRAEDVENRLIMLARSGQLRQRVNEDQLKDILSAVAEQQKESAAAKVVVQRRGAAWDDDDLDDLLNED
ncbi:DNA-binding TFAR19-related protein [Dissoconium aciculare CBS 342.82]|uniref:DNA-binding TFAR19-related protein n=1 Tax=Dissoconium aciculare CBS 342.82 TaxID=1314786 RepID=A0A6J3LU81_9PEZI|nr:DNA-binding TFAR19-related protein [Dissoconium aciculare CBS 342.82]KAF1819346.1 DNA-binding TFAR19-related protein [Dissoconium aciculare CBS 342.82]